MANEVQEPRNGQDDTTRPTIRNVALEAGVSAATVSRVFNNPQSVTTQVRERVLASAKRLHYTPNADAARLGKHQRLPRPIRQIKEGRSTVVRSIMSDDWRMPLEELQSLRGEAMQMRNMLEGLMHRLDLALSRWESTLNENESTSRIGKQGILGDGHS